MPRLDSLALRNAILAALVLPLLGCDPTGGPTNCCAEAADTLATALVDGRPVGIPLEAWKNNGLWMIHGTQETVFILAYRPGSGSEGITIWLDGFHGIGAYPVTGSMAPGTSETVYWQGPIEGGTSYWGDWVTGDTVWVTAYDPETRAIGGHFTTRGRNGADTVKVTEGRYRGVIQDYVYPP